MEEQNQEEVTTTQYVKATDAAAPEMGDGKEEDRGGEEKEKKIAKPFTPKQLQQRKKLMVYPLMGLLFLGSMWLIFTPSEEREVNRDTAGMFNAGIPLPGNGEIIGDERKAYEQVRAKKRQAGKVRSLEGFALSEGSGANGVEMELPDSGPERESFRDYSGDGGSRSPVAAYWDINRKLGSFYEKPKVDGEKEELERQVEEPTAKLEGKKRQAGGIDDQVALMEKSYEPAAEYMGQSGQGGATVQIPAAVQNGNSLGRPAVAAQAARERTVSGLQQSLSDAEFIRRYSQPRNYGLNTAVGSGYTFGKNTIVACIHQDQTVMDGQQVRLRLFEPLQTGNLTTLCSMAVSSTGKMQGERFNITAPSVQYQGNMLPVELAVYDNEGMKGLCIETSLEREAVKEAMVNIDGGLGTGISFAQSVGQQMAMDIIRGLMQGDNQYLVKRFCTVRVHLKAGGLLTLCAK